MIDTKYLSLSLSLIRFVSQFDANVFFFEGEEAARKPTWDFHVRSV